MPIDLSKPAPANRNWDEIYGFKLEWILLAEKLNPPPHQDRDVWRLGVSIPNTGFSMSCAYVVGHYGTARNLLWHETRLDLEAGGYGPVHDEL